MLILFYRYMKTVNLVFLDYVQIKVNIPLVNFNTSEQFEIRKFVGYVFLSQPLKNKFFTSQTHLFQAQSLQKRRHYFNGKHVNEIFI